MPPIETDVTAAVRFTWIPATRELRYATSVNGVHDDDVLFMHLHRGEMGEVGPVVVTFPRTATARSSGTVTLTAAQRDAFESGELYFNVHTRD